jgi:hypothetical protein
MWKNFYIGERFVGGYTLEGEFAGEEEATKNLLAYDNGVTPDEITTIIEKR